MCWQQRTPPHRHCKGMKCENQICFWFDFITYGNSAWLERIQVVAKKVIASDQDRWLRVSCKAL
jgi:hypothetical protein